MRRIDMKKRKLNNDGMTLIEILIAMVILTVVLVPMLYSFVRVAMFNLKSRDLQQATVVAQTVMENCKAYSMEDINYLAEAPQNKFYSGVTGDATYYQHNPAADGESIEYVMTDVQVENKKYDVFLKLTPYKDATGTYTKSVTTLENMNPTLDGVFIEESTLNASSKTVQDIEDEAYNTILSNISAGIKESYQLAIGVEKYNEYVLDPTTFYPESVIAESFFGSDTANPNYGNLTVERYVYLDTNKDAITGEESATVTYTYYYELAGNKYTYKAKDVDGNEREYEWIGWTGSDTNGNGVSEVTAGTTFAVYSNAGTNDATSHPTKLERLYFFYYPLYNDATCNVPPCTKDSFVIDNKISRPVDVYILKQRNSAISDLNVLSIAESIYTPYIGTKAGSNQVNLYHNMNVNISGYASPAPGTSTINVFSPSTVSTDYIKKETKSLMYNVAVEVYKEDSYDITNKVMIGSPVLTLDGTKVDW